MARYGPHDQHCSPRRPGEPYPQYLARFKTWKKRRDGEHAAVRLARLPTPESNIDSDSDSDSNASSDMNIDTRLPAQFPRPAIANTGQRPSLNIPSSLSCPSPTPSPTVVESQPESLPAPYATSKHAATTSRIISHQETTQNRHRSHTQRSGAIHKASTPHLRSRSRLSRSTCVFLELDHHGLPCIAKSSSSSG